MRFEVKFSVLVYSNNSRVEETFVSGSWKIECFAIHEDQNASDVPGLSKLPASS
jgi:hypothetical protein